jgi:hypothetical protein
MEELWEAVFSVGSVPKLYHEGQWDKPISQESRGVKSSESAVGSWKKDPSDVAADGNPLAKAWEVEEPPVL